MPPKPQYEIVFGQRPSEMSAHENAVLIGMTARLLSYGAIPGFDPTTAVLSITFASGRKGVAQLTEQGTTSRCGNGPLGGQNGYIMPLPTLGALGNDD